jgi:DNA-binding response OmpR family regulator
VWYEQPHGADVYISLKPVSVRVLLSDVMCLRRRKHETNTRERKNTEMCLLDKENPTISAFDTTNGCMRVYIWTRIQSRRSR